jgi:hypothetical protein
MFLCDLASQSIPVHIAKCLDNKGRHRFSNAPSTLNDTHLNCPQKQETRYRLYVHFASFYSSTLPSASSLPLQTSLAISELKR